MSFEKLWDGSLQLSSSVTVSAVAFFKSGERLLDINWSRSVVVKGRVKLDEFEKYILELPRARTRGLMIVSICAKNEGSSWKGVKDLIEISKAYIKGERVGIAELSSSVHVYLCPRSDQIFRILEKYGTLDGVRDANEKLDSLIGCVIWKKNQTVENAGLKEKDNKVISLEKQPQESTTNSSPQDAAESGKMAKYSSSSVPLQNLISTSIRSFSRDQSMSISSKEVGIGNSSAATICETPSVTSAVYHSSSGCSNLSSQTTSKRFHFGSETAKTGVEVPRKFNCVPSEGVKWENQAYDDDDLPEYDYGTSSTHSGSSLNQELISLPMIIANCDTQFHGFQSYASPAPYARFRGFMNNDVSMPELFPPQEQHTSSFPAPTDSHVSLGFPVPYHQSTHYRLPMQSGSSLLTGYKYSRDLRPPSCYPFQPADRRK